MKCCEAGRSSFLSSLKSKAKWQKQLRVHLEQVNYAGAVFSKARSTLIHSVAFLFKWPLPESSLCCYHSNAPSLEQNLNRNAENEDFPPQLWMVAGLYYYSCVCSATGKGFSSVPFSQGPRRPQPLSAVTGDWCVVGSAVVNSNFYLLPAATAQVPGAQRAAGSGI